MSSTMLTLDLSLPENRGLLEEALAQCASEPIHLIGCIQPHGVLLAVNPQHWTVRAASANLHSLFSCTAEQAIGQALEKVLGAQQTAYLRSLVKPAGDSSAAIGSIGLLVDSQMLTLDVQVSRTQDDLVIEIERQTASSADVFHQLFIPIRDALWRLDAETDMLRYAAAVVDQVRLLTGFDRVMMYRFDANWDGEVIAESKIEKAISYLGNRFPASDIPAQARELYTKNLVRVIADIDAEPIALLVDGNASQPVDLSFSWLRNMSPVHLEYLRNMGVRASLSISLVQNGKLWGLVACHHLAPRYVSIRERELDELIGRTVSLKLTYMDNAERDALSARVRDLLLDMTETARHADDVEKIIGDYYRELTQLVSGSGVVVSIGGVQHCFGNLPPSAAIQKLLEALRHFPPAPVFCTQSLAELCNEMQDYADIASGMMLAPLNPSLQDFVLWFRPAALRTLRWAGKPHKAVLMDGKGIRISPRQSFETWIETHRDKSLPWTQAEIDAINSFAYTAIRILTQRTLRSREENYRLLAEHSTDMIASLNLDGTFRFLSPACKEIFGVAAEELLGKSFQALIRQQDRPGIKRALTELQTAGSQSEALVSIDRADGIRRWLEVSMKRIGGLRDNDEIVINVRDITQRYAYQLVIEEVHRRYSSILDAAGEALISLDRDGKIIYANEMALRLLGMTMRQIINVEYSQLLCCIDKYGNQIAQEQCPFIATLDKGETQQGILGVRNQSSRQMHPTGFLATPLFNKGIITGCVVILNQQVLNLNDEQTQQTEVILERSEEAVMVTDATGRIQSVNRAFMQITGYSAEEAIGQTPRLLRSGVHTPNFYQNFWNSLEQKHSWQGEIWNKRKNGEIYPQWGSVTAVLDNAGAVKNYIAIFSDISKAKQAEERLHYLATHDVLTGLPNRTEFCQKLNYAITQCKREGLLIAVVFIDLDHFKTINDTLGHAVGDIYLQRIAERLTSIIRKHDILSRWGGDEFVLALVDIESKQTVAETLTRLLRKIAHPVFLADHELVPQASLGVSIYPEDAELPDDLIKAADAAMYRAKDKGRNCFEFYTAQMQAELDEKFRLAAEMRRALDQNEFRVFYQPQIHAQNSHIIGVEALVRWQHPTRGLIGPEQFVMLAEEIGLICELGEWILREACRQKQQWANNAVAIPRIAVNVSPLQLKHGFVEMVGRVLEEFAMEPSSLELEITEGTLDRGEEVRQMLLALRKLGVLLSVDDFGTGYSSLAHIRRFPITCFKIDKSFIDGLPHNDEDVAIVRTILALGSSLNVEVVAEGVETAEQLNCLRACGVNYLQGYYFSPAVAPEELLAWIHQFSNIHN